MWFEDGGRNHKPRKQATRSWKKERLFPSGHQKEPSTQTSWLQSYGTYVWVLTSRTVRAYICVPLSHQACGNLWHQAIVAEYSISQGFPGDKLRYSSKKFLASMTVVIHLIYPTWRLRLTINCISMALVIFPHTPSCILIRKGKGFWIGVQSSQ